MSIKLSLTATLLVMDPKSFGYAMLDSVSTRHTTKVPSSFRGRSYKGGKHEESSVLEQPAS